MGFTKLDSGIIDSSIWSAPLATRVVWITFLAKADSKGMVSASCSGMQRASNVGQEEFELALKSLESPDPDSRSPENEGRRIGKVEGGWLVFNYPKYRAFSYSGSKEAEKKRKQRQKRRGQKGTKKGHVPFVPGHSASASASSLSSLNKDIEEIKRGWNEFAVKNNLATIAKIDPRSERGRHLAARMAEKDWDFLKLLEAVSLSPFLLGKKGKEPFFVTFDWLLWPGNYLRIMEGNYLERGKPAGPAPGSWLKTMKEREARGEKI